MIKSKILVIVMGIGLMLVNNTCRSIHIPPNVPSGERLEQAFEHCYNLEKYCCRTTEWWGKESKAKEKHGIWNKSGYIGTMIFNAPNLLYQETQISGRPDPIINCYINSQEAIHATESYMDRERIIRGDSIFLGFLVYPNRSPDPILDPIMTLKDGLLNSPFYLSSQIKILERYFRDRNNIKLYYDGGTRYKEDILCDAIVVEPLKEIYEGLLSPVKNVKIEFFRITFWIRSGTVPLIDKIIYEVHFRGLDPNIQIGGQELWEIDKEVLHKLRQERMFDYENNLIIPVSIKLDTRNIIEGKRIYPPKKPPENNPEKE